MRKKISLLAILFTMMGFAVKAQETTSEIQGIVTDTKKAPLTGATVTAVHLPTGTKYVTTSRKDGRFNLTNVRIGGPYTITTSFVGYKEEKQEDVFLTLGTAYKTDYSLQNNDANLTEVVVTGRRSDKVFSKSRTGSAEIITRQQIDRLPTTNRSISDYTRLTPTANGSSFAGRSSSYNNLTVNGASFNNTFGLAGSLGGQTSSQPFSIDALEQIQVNIAPYDVTLGGFTGAGINSVTKSGTNEFKGSIYEFLKKPDWTGTKIANTNIAKQDFNFKNRGVSFGGPIIKNKLFFFVSGEQERISTPGTARVASRNGSTGDNVSQASGEVLDQLKTFLIQKFNYDPGAYENYTFDTYSDKVTARVDFNINSKNTFNINYYYLKSYRNVAASNSGAPGNSRQPSNTAMPFISSSYIINNNFNIVIAELNTRLTNQLSNKIQVGYNRLRDFRSSPGSSIFPLVDIENGQGATLTSFGYEPFTANNILSTDTWQFNDIVTLYKGKHTFNFGTQNTYNKFVNGFAPNYYGNYRFANVDSFYASVNSGRANATRYALQYSARKGGEFPFASLKALQLGFFVQDKWNLSKDFTLTIGLRADLPIFEQNFITNANADALTYRDGVRIETGRAPSTQILWSPRVGFNYDVSGDKSLQLRGGAGVFAGAPPFVWLSNQLSNNGVDFGSFTNTSGVAFTPDVNAYVPQNATANTAYNLAVTDQKFKFPQLFRANLAADYKLPGDITVTLEGIYNKDINGVYHQNINLPSTGTPLLGYDNRTRYSSSKIWSGAGGVSAANPNISDAILMKNTAKGYTYNATLQLQRNVKNLYTMIAYSYGDSRSVNDGGSIAQSIWRDRSVSGDPNDDVTSYSNFYQPHRIVAAAAYRFEYAKHFATSFGITFEAANSGTASYLYVGDLNNDGLTSNDLIYVPAAKDEIILERAGSAAADPRTTDEIWNQLNAYISQDDYLSKRRGKYAERNGMLLPWYSKADLNFTQDFFVNVGGKRNTIRFTMDIFNFTNLLNRNWGILKTPNRTNLLNFLRVETAGANAGKPVFSFPYFDAANKVPLGSTFQNSTSQASRYQIQLGVRYIFN